jgi:DNA internalization-related competence protein ComEC/Rec2
LLYLWSFAAGIIHIPVYSFPWSVPLLSCAALGCLLLSRYQKIFMGALACAFLGMALGSWNLQRLCAAQLSPQFDQSVHTITFTIVSIPRKSPASQAFVAEINDVGCVGAECPMELLQRRVRLSWYRAQHDLQTGQIWQGPVKLRRPRGTVNLHGFDYHAWLLAQDVVATGSVRKAEHIGERWTWAGYRATLLESLLDSGESPYRRFWAALLIGEQSEISQDDWARLQATGTVHLLVISGLHVGLVAGWCFLLGAVFGRILGCCHRGSNALVMQWLPPLLACAGAAYYAALAGFSIPTIRALVACLALMLCRVFGLNLSPFTLLGVALAVVGLNEPLAWESAGFWLSFLAVALLFYVFSGRRQQKPLRAFLVTQPIMAVGLMLPLWLSGQSASLSAPVANLVAVPVVSFLLVPGLLLSALIHPVIPAAAYWLLRGMDQVFTWLWWWLGMLQDLPVLLWWPSHQLTTLDLLLIGAGVVLLLAPAGLRVRGIGALWLVIALGAVQRPDYLLRVTVMDVGQGQAVILQTPGKTWLYDAGPAFSDNFDAGSRIVAPYLRHLGVRQLDLMISHADLDHAGGAQSIATAFRVDRLIVGETLDTLPGAGELCRQGQSWQEDSVTFTIVWPPEDHRLSGNNSSCVLLVEVPTEDGVARLLLPGDVDRSVERKLLEVLADPVDWVLAPHHGSNSSSSYRLLYRLRPQHVVFSAGYKNRYGHPHPKVEQRYAEMGTASYNTATDGALVFTWRPDGLEVAKAREQRVRLWHLLLPR